ncbi:MAG: hypothetical protein R3C16_03730 [Hyphomonadaceae bacterium]
MHERAVAALIAAVRRFADTGTLPTLEERMVSLSRTACHISAKRARAAACARLRVLMRPGEYAVSITQPKFFRAYLIEQFRLSGGGLRRWSRSACA